MSRLIDADRLYEVIKSSWDTSDAEDFEKSVFVALATAPTIEERKTGKWIELDSDEDRYDEIKCPHCRHTFTVDTYHWTDIGFTKSDLNFCPNCGADMRGGGNSMGRLIDTDEYEKRIKPYDTEDVMDKALYNFAHEKLVTTPTALRWIRMIEQWNELKETIIELRDNDGKGSQQEVCKFLSNLMDVLEKQMKPERKKGKWVVYDGDWLKTMCKCSECGAMIDINEKYRNFFCYHCGADMRGEEG